MKPGKISISGLSVGRSATASGRLSTNELNRLSRICAIVKGFDTLVKRPQSGEELDFALWRNRLEGKKIKPCQNGYTRTSAS